jgi:hypothetical protein
VRVEAQVSFGEARAKDYRGGTEGAEKGENINTEYTEKTGEHGESGARGGTFWLAI